MYDVIVIGGGSVGTSVAYHAVAAGAKTLLVDRVDPDRANAAGAGILTPETSAIGSDAWFRPASAAVDYGKIIADLALGETVAQDLEPFTSSRF